MPTRQTDEEELRLHKRAIVWVLILLAILLLVIFTGCVTEDAGAPPTTPLPSRFEPVTFLPTEISDVPKSRTGVSPVSPPAPMAARRSTRVLTTAIGPQSGRFFYLTARNFLGESLPSNLVICTNPLPVTLQWDYPYSTEFLDGFILHFGFLGRWTNTAVLSQTVNTISWPPGPLTAAPPTTVILTWTGNGARIYRGLIPRSSQLALLTNAPGTSLSVPLDRSVPWFFTSDKKLAIQIR